MHYGTYSSLFAFHWQRHRSILEPENGEYFTVNGVGTEMISLLEEGKDEEGVVSAMVSRFDVSEDEVRKDYAELVASLLEQGLIEKA